MSDCLILSDSYGICAANDAANDAESCDTYARSTPAPHLADISSDVVHIIHMTSFCTDMIIYSNERVRIVKCGRGLLLTATAALTQLTRIIHLPNVRLHYRNKSVLRLLQNYESPQNQVKSKE